MNSTTSKQGIWFSGSRPVHSMEQPSPSLSIDTVVPRAGLWTEAARLPSLLPARLPWSYQGTSPKVVLFNLRSSSLLGLPCLLGGCRYSTCYAGTELRTPPCLTAAAKVHACLVDPSGQEPRRHLRTAPRPASSSRPPVIQTLPMLESKVRSIPPLDVVGITFPASANVRHGAS